jgi:phage tail sheath protein FI
MPYTHGVYIQEQATSVIAPIIADSGVQFVVGTAPVNLLADPASAVNKPILANNFGEAGSGVGYSDSFDKFSLCESIDVSFRVFNVAPLVLVNVLDPAKHITAVVGASHNVTSGKITLAVEGILQDSNFVVKKSDGSGSAYVKNTDYTLEFDDDGFTVLTVKTGGAIAADVAALQIAYNKLDPSQVDAEDIIGGIDAATGKATGLQAIKYVRPMFALTPGLILCPGWSQNPAVKAAMTAVSTGINGLFKAAVVCDVDTGTDGAKTYTAVNTWKNANSYTDIRDIVCWPMVQVGTKKYHMSAMLAALIAYTDANSDNVPYVSPSNKPFRITGACLADGTEVFLDLLQANILNGQGVVTALNLDGWRAWGNRTGAYPGQSDPKDTWIPVRRMFDWWGNSFILTYFQKVDNPMNIRLIESIVDSENIRANGYRNRFQLADARIEFNISENPTTDLISGKIRFHQYLTPFPPAETIIDVLEFDADSLAASLGGES